jgi:hypothetical protein
MSKSTSFLGSNNRDLAILKSKQVYIKLVNCVLSKEAKSMLMSESDFVQIQKQNLLIAQYTSYSSILRHHAQVLLCFLGLSVGTCNEGLITTLYREFKAACPPGIIEEMLSQLHSLSQADDYVKTPN